jgi:hypothetical protein
LVVHGPVKQEPLAGLHANIIGQVLVAPPLQVPLPSQLRAPISCPACVPHRRAEQIEPAA